MKLQFLGTGSAFQTKLYNTSAFFVEDDILFMIDCGQTAFEQLKAQNFFKDIVEIFVVFTHTHADHIGSISKLVNYSYNVLDKPLNIIVPDEENLYKDIVSLLEIFLIKKEKYNMLLPYEITNFFKTFESITFLPTRHTKVLENRCYSLVFNTPYGNVLYTGDSTDTKYIKRLINTHFDKIYVDITLTSKDVHLDLNTLKKIVPKELRNKVYPMHFGSFECLNVAYEMEFNTVSSVAVDLSNLPLSFEYRKIGNNLILSNCNELAFLQIINLGLLNGIEAIYVTVENNSLETICGIGSLLTYSHFILKKPVYISKCDDITESKIIHLAKIYGANNSSLSFSDIDTKYFFNLPSTNLYYFDILGEKFGKSENTLIPVVKYFNTGKNYNSAWMVLSNSNNLKTCCFSEALIYYNVVIYENDVILEYNNCNEDVFIYKVKEINKNSKKAICDLLAYGNLKISFSITSNPNIDLSNYLEAIKSLNEYLLYLDKTNF